MRPSPARVAFRWLLSRGLGPLRLVKLWDEDDPDWGGVYEMPLRADTFVHFTLAGRAKAIVESGKLLMRPPYKKFGIDAVNAVSLTYGESVPGVQSTHLQSLAKRENDDLVALVFKTTTKPKYGHVDEVVWDRDVTLNGPRIYPLAKGVSMIRGAPVRLTGQMDQVVYT